MRRYQRGDRVVVQCDDMEPPKRKFVIHDPGGDCVRVAKSMDVKYGSNYHRSFLRPDDEAAGIVLDGAI